MIRAIVAVDKNFGMGYKDQLLESIPEDLMSFKEFTWGSFVIMGRKTYESLPKRPLPGRINVVITSKAEQFGLHTCGETIYMNMETVESFLANDMFRGDVYIIGGGKIFERLLKYCEIVMLTKIHKRYKDVDTYFPNIRRTFKLAVKNPVQVSKTGVKFHFERWDRK